MANLVKECVSFRLLSLIDLCCCGLIGFNNNSNIYSTGYVDYTFTRNEMCGTVRDELCWCVLALIKSAAKLSAPCHGDCNQIF